MVSIVVQAPQLNAGAGPGTPGWSAPATATTGSLGVGAGMAVAARGGRSSWQAVAFGGEGSARFLSILLVHVAQASRPHRQVLARCHASPRIRRRLPACSTQLHNRDVSTAALKRLKRPPVEAGPGVDSLTLSRSYELHGLDEVSIALWNGRPMTPLGQPR